LCVMSIEVRYIHTDEMRVQRGVVYIMKSKGPTTEPRGTSYSEVCKEAKQSLHFT